jgi:antitoxin VapB
MRSAKLFRNGRSQAMRLPKEFPVDTAEVYLKKISDGFLVIPRDPWEIFFEGIEELSADLMGRRPPTARTQERRVEVMIYLLDTA